MSGAVSATASAVALVAGSAQAPPVAAGSGSLPGLDAGLLSPVRAGTPAEAAVCDTAWLQAMLDAEAALARAQATTGTLPASAAQTITAVAHADRFDLTALARGSRLSANPVVGLVHALTALVAAQDPAAAEYVHHGSTSQDILDTAAMLVADRTLRIIRGDLTRVIDALTALALEHRDTPMAGRTLALHAAPTTFGLKAAGWRHLVSDARLRVDRLLDGNLPFSLGGAAGTLAGYLPPGPRPVPVPVPDGLLDRLADAYAGETGLARPVLPWHTLRTPLADLAAALAFTTGALGKIAIDVQSLTRTEVAEVTEPAAAGRGASSAMPHKRNPVLATLIRCAALQVPVIAAGLTQCLVAEDERSAGAWHAEWALLRECLRLAGGAAHTAAELTAGLVVDPARMHTNLHLTGGRIVSERLTRTLAPHLGARTAKDLITRACRTADTTGTPLGTVLAGAPELHGLLDAADLTDLLDPTTYTGAAAALVDTALTTPPPPPRPRSVTGPTP
ncbi:3-carboxy-cis,cis-muconate cycloisomerase [Streptomyces fildesensis]|uniref:3-carboxy-cis,cis-muconate cycloisomerase n=1 Tax=Streptomyces fildesensis TaxID=375757 RepID=A0ABW8CJD6_9ACTN